jgi:hypothetical protein
VRGKAWLNFCVEQVKVRAIDPPVLQNGSVRLLSELDGEFAGRREAYVAERNRPLDLWMTTDEDSPGSSSERVA